MRRSHLCAKALSVTILATILLFGSTTASAGWQSDTTGATTGSTTGGTTGTDTTGGDTGTTATGLQKSEQTSLSAIRMSVVNGLVRTINQTRQVTMALSFEPLPLTKNLVDEAARYGIQPVKFTVSNSQMDHGDWIKGLSADKQNALYDALNLDRGTTWKDGKDLATQALAGYDARWNSDGKKGYPNRADINNALEARELFASERDFRYLLFVLRSKGVSCSFGTDAEVRGSNPRVFKDDISWEFTVFPFPFYQSPNGSVVLNRFRVAVKAVVRPFPLQFTNADQTKANLHATFAFIRGLNKQGFVDDDLLGLDSGFLTVDMSSDRDLPANKADADKLQESTNSLSESSLSANLKLLGGVDLTDVVAKGLFSGSADTSLISGGILGRGKVRQVIGMNTDLRRWGDRSVGYALGVLPNDNNALFGGLSVQYKDLFLSPGFLAEEAGGGDKTAFKPVLGLSFDLSRVLGTKKDNTYILDNATIGGDYWKESTDQIAASTASLNYRVEKTGDWNPLASRDTEPRLVITPFGDANAKATTYLLRSSTPETPTGTNPNLPTPGNSGSGATVFVPVGKGVVAAPLGYDLLNAANLEASTTPTASDDRNEVTQHFAGHTLSVPVVFTTGRTVTLRYHLRPSAALYKSADSFDFAKLQAGLATDDEAHKALKGFVDPTIVAQIVDGDGTGLDKQEVLRAFNRVLAGKLLTEDANILAAVQGDPVIANLLKPENKSKNSKRVELNRRVLEHLLPDAFAKLMP